MSMWLWIAVGVLVASGVLMLGAWVAWRRASADGRQLMRRINRLPLRAKLRFAGALVRDERLPWAVRLIPAGIVLYLAMPIDIVPDFIPVLGQLDDILLVVLGVGLLMRLTPRDVIEEHLADAAAQPGHVIDG